MKTIQQVLQIKDIEADASRSNLRFGKEIARAGKFSVKKENAFNVFVTITHGGSKKESQVELTQSSKGLRWKCSCSARKDNFCEHCIALGLWLCEKWQPKEED